MLVCSIVFFFGLGSIALLGPDEPRYAQVAREMYERRDLVTPTLLGHTWFEKPALLYWMIMACYSLFGINEWAARLPNAVLATLAVLMVYRLGKQVSNDLFGLKAALVLSTSALYLGLARAASFDMTLTFTFTLALTLFYTADTAQSSRQRVISLIGFYISLGLSFLAKGLVGPVLIVATVISYELLSGGIRLLRLRPFYGLLLSLTVASLWYLPVILKHGWPFIDEFFVQHHFQRYTSNKYRHPGPPWYFLLVILVGAFPWSLFLFSATKGALKLLRQDLGDKLQMRLPLLLVLWMVIPLLFFSFSGSKLPGYILPIFPAIALLVAAELDASSKKIWVLAGSINLLGLLLSVYSARELGKFTVLPFVCSLGLAVYALYRRSLLAIFCHAPLMVAIIVITLFPAVELKASTAEVSKKIMQQALPGEKLVFFGYLSYTPVFYAANTVLADGREDVVKVDTVQDLEKYLSSSLLCLTRRPLLVQLDKHYELQVVAAQQEVVLVRIQRRNPIYRQQSEERSVSRAGPVAVATRLDGGKSLRLLRRTRPGRSYRAP